MLHEKAITFVQHNKKNLNFVFMPYAIMPPLINSLQDGCINLYYRLTKFLITVRIVVIHACCAASFCIRIKVRLPYIYIFFINAKKPSVLASGNKEILNYYVFEPTKLLAKQ